MLVLITAAAFFISLVIASYLLGRYHSHKECAVVERIFVDKSGIGNRLPTMTDVMAGKTMNIEVGENMYVSFPLFKAEVVHCNLPIIQMLVDQIGEMAKAKSSKKAVFAVYRMLVKQVLEVAITPDKKTRKAFEKKMLDVDFVDEVVENIIDYHTTVIAKKKALGKGQTRRRTPLRTDGGRVHWSSIIGVSHATT